MKFLYCFFYISVISLTYAQPDITAFINGKIYTVNEKQPLVEAVVIQGNKILFVGTNDDYAKHVNNESVIIDLQGKLMLPGFIDNHTHFISGGFYLNGIDLRSAKTTTEFINLIKDYAELNPGKWITGGNWDHEAWEKKVYPCKEWIDEFTPNTPVFVDRFDGHMGIANSYALKLAGITKETESPAGGFIEKDPITGEPTGILKDNAMSLVYRVVPDGSDDDYYQAGLTALDEAKSLGVTSIQDITYSKDLEIYKKLESENKLTCRIYTRTPLYDYKSLVKENIKVGTGNSYLKMGGLKAFADGSLGSSSALFFEPYENEPENCGLAMEILSNGNLKKWAMEADKNNLQICVHAIGDSANSEMLSIYEEIVKTNPEWDRRFRIEHSQHVRFEDIDRFAKLGVIASVQPYHCIDDGVWAEKRIGKERIKYTYPFRTFLDKGVHLCFGSDWTVAPLNPILGIYAAVTRRTLDGKNPGGWLPEQKLTVEEAVKCYTINNAYASFDEKGKEV
jgi:predicted amidohydrolase YtcJ